MSSLLNAFANLFSLSFPIFSSTTTMALFKLPPLIRLLSINSSSSCKKQNVREEDISLLKLEIDCKLAC